MFTLRALPINTNNREKTSESWIWEKITNVHVHYVSLYDVTCLFTLFYVEKREKWGPKMRIELFEIVSGKILRVVLAVVVLGFCLIIHC